MSLNLTPLILKTAEEKSKMTEQELADMSVKNEKIATDNFKAFKDFTEGQVKEIESLTATLKTQGEELAILKTKNSKNVAKKSELMKKSFDESFAKILERKNAGISQLKELFPLNSSTKINDETVSLILKATQTYGDIDAGEDFAQMRPGIIDKPVRRTGVMRSLFRVLPVSTEFYKYVEQETVVRDAKNVAKCAPVTSNTKESLKTTTVETKVIKDVMAFCLQFVLDYPFMQSRIQKLIVESVALKEDQQLLLGTGIGLETNSVDSVSSEFDPSNVDCPVDGKIQAPSMVDLILAMRTQITVFGQQNAYMPDTVLVNLCDWFLGVESRKDANNNYLDSRVTYVNGIPYIQGMQIIPLPLVATNTLYVFDSMKGEILDRGIPEVSIATENGTDWEQEFASIKAIKRINFVVANNNKNAFMKCSDIDAAITAITKV